MVHLRLLARLWTNQTGDVLTVQSDASAQRILVFQGLKPNFIYP